jgi:hypothetical protein
VGGAAGLVEIADDGAGVALGWEEAGGVVAKGLQEGFRHRSTWKIWQRYRELHREGQGGEDFASPPAVFSSSGLN